MLDERVVMLEEGVVYVRIWSHTRGLMICVKEGFIRVRNRWEEGGKKEMLIKRTTREEVMRCRRKKRDV
jgi:hypothetical protein